MSPVPFLSPSAACSVITAKRNNRHPSHSWEYIYIPCSFSQWRCLVWFQVVASVAEHCIEFTTWKTALPARRAQLMPPRVSLGICLLDQVTALQSENAWIVGTTRVQGGTWEIRPISPCVQDQRQSASQDPKALSSFLCAEKKTHCQKPIRGCK